MNDSLFVDFQDSDRFPPAPSEYYTVFIVDDDIFVHDSTKFVFTNYVLNNKSIKFLDAYSGAEALELIKHNSVDLILLDAVMESESAGIDFAEHVKQNIGNIPIIMRSGFAGWQMESIKDKHTCIDDFLYKTDTTRNILMTKVGQWLSQKV